MFVSPVACPTARRESLLPHSRAYPMEERLPRGTTMANTVRIGEGGKTGPQHRMMSFRREVTILIQMKARGTLIHSIARKR